MAIGTTFINLQTDFGFKRLFGSKKHTHILLRFINALFEGRMVVTDVEFHDKEILPHSTDGKKIIYDIYCTTDTGKHFILEMQQSDTPNFSKRILFYTSQAIVGQGQRGVNYEIQPVYTIIITGFDLRNMSKKLVHEILLKERISNEIYSEDIILMFISLEQVKEEWNKCNTELEKLLYLIKNMHKMDKNSEPYRSKKYADLFDASETSMLAAEDVVAYSQSYEKMVEDQAAIAYAGELSRIEGRKEGRKEGMQEGRRQAAIEVARKLMAMNMDISTIADVTGLDRNVIAGLGN
ncbi:MAG: Rpn family recombination-promoting nuclease/putative transposase [Muribaculaceae bacterium]|nr:Rpn family recombination-promoting nuclease/putative transposase [Muribaculaceae bacterium]